MKRIYKAPHCILSVQLTGKKVYSCFIIITGYYVYWQTFIAHLSPLAMFYQGLRIRPIHVKGELSRI